MTFLCIGIFFTALDLIFIKKLKKGLKKKIIVIVFSLLSLGGLIYGTISLSNNEDCCECRDCKECDICCKCSYPYYYK